MNTYIPREELSAQSWAKDFVRIGSAQRLLYIQSVGHYFAAFPYRIINRSHLNSTLLLYTLKGTGCLEYKGEKVFLENGSCAIIDCSLPHSYYCEKDSEWEFYWIHFCGNAISGYIDEILRVWGSAFLPDIEDSVHRLLQLCERSDTPSVVECSTTLIDICSRVLLVLLSNTPQRALFPENIARAMAYIEENHEREVSLDEVCDYLHMSKFHFSRLFRAKTGTSPHDYLIAVRLSHAKALLQNTDRSVEDISDAVGFGSCSHFISIFKRREALTPKEYRRAFTVI